MTALIFASLVTLALVQTGPVKSQSNLSENQQSNSLTPLWLSVRITDVQISQPVTFYDIPPQNDPDSVVLTNVQDEASSDILFTVLRPSQNNVPFTLRIDVESLTPFSVIVKTFACPPRELVANKSDFAQIDWFQYNLNTGQNVLERSSEDFFQFTDGSQNIKDIYQLLDQNQLPADIEQKYVNLPKRTVLPSNTRNGVPLQFFVVLYPSTTPREDLEPFKDVILDDKPFAYPLDRPMLLPIILQPNMYLKDSAA